MSRGELRKAALLLGALVLACVLAGCQQVDMEALAIGIGTLQPRQDPDFSNIQRVAKLATYECTYHGVVRIERDADVPIPVIQPGMKREWYEYDATVEFGIDATKVEVLSGPDDNGEVTIAIPEAQVLYAPDVQQESMSEPISSNGWFSSPTAEEKTEALSQATAEMREKAEADDVMLANARQRAKELIESYVVNAGKEIGKTYTVKWEDAE